MTEPPLVLIRSVLEGQTRLVPLTGMRLLRRDRFSGAQTDPTPTCRHYRFRFCTVFERPGNMSGLLQAHRGSWSTEKFVAELWLLLVLFGHP